MVSLILSTFSCHILLSPFKNEAQDERCGDERAGDRAWSLGKGGMQWKTRPQPLVENTTCSQQETPLLQTVFLTCREGMQAAELCQLMLPCSDPGSESAGEIKHNTLTATKTDPKIYITKGPDEDHKCHIIPTN